MSINDVQLLERLTADYAALDAPAPSAELAARMDAGWVGTHDPHRDAVVVPFAARPRARVRYLVAAMVSTFVVFSGLAAAGALPDPVQHRVSSVVAHLGVELPDPNPPASAKVPGPPSAPGAPGASGASGGSGVRGSTPGVSGSSPSAGTGAGASGTTAPTTAPVGTLPGGGEVGASGSDPTVPTTVPGGLLGLPLPELTLPPITVPPVTLPPVTVPQLLPPINLNLDLDLRKLLGL